MSKRELYLYAGGALALWYLAGRAARAAGAMVEAVNPASGQNVLYQWLSEPFDQADNGQDDDSATLGTWLFDLLNPEQGRILNDGSEYQ